MLGATVSLSYAGTVAYKFNGLNVTRDGGVTYLRGTSPSEVAAAAVSVENGAIRATGSANWYSGVGALVQNGGVVFNAVIPLAATAGAVALTAVRANPVGLVTSAVASYLLEKGIQYANGQFTKTGSGEYQGDATAGCVGVTQHISASSASTMCYQALSFVQSVGNNGCATPTQPGNMTLVGASETGCTVHGVNDNGQAWDWGFGFTHGASSGGGAPTESDWAAVRAGRWPDPAMLDLVRHGVALPTDAPVFSPTSQDVPASDPYTDPVTGKKYRDMVRITPSPSNPDTADIQAFKQELDANGNPVGGGNGGNGATDQTDLCKLHPEILACQQLDTPDGPELPNQDKTLTITPDGGWGPDNGTCPPDKTLNLRGGQTVVIEYQPVCQVATSMRPVMIGFAWLTAVLIAIGITRKYAE